MGACSKLVISIATLGSGGAERVLSILSSAFADSIDEVIIILWKNSKIFYTVDKRVSIIDLTEITKSTNDFRKALCFRKIIKSIQPDCILSFLYPYSIRVILSLLGLNQKIIVAERRDPRVVKGGRVIRCIRDLLYCLTDRILVQSFYNKSFYPKFLQSKIDVIYNPIRIDTNLPHIDDKEKLRKEIVTVGRLIPEKNHKLLIDSFCEFYKNSPDYVLSIWGDGPLKDELEHYAYQKGLKSGMNFFLHGNSTNVLAEIRSSYIFVLTSYTEGMPNALYEAICSGLPSISTKVSGIFDLLQDHKNALIVDSSANDICRSMEEICNDRNLYERLSMNGKELYTKLNPTIIENKWVSVIRDVCAS